MKFFRKHKIRIGFIVEHDLDYNTVMASTRLRCYDVIDYLNSKGIEAGLYDESKEYNIVIFQKVYSPKYMELAAKLKKKGVKTILDININIIEREGDFPVEQPQHYTDDIKDMLSVVDHVLVSSPNLNEVYSKYHRSVFCIEENVTDNFFAVKKEHYGTNKLKLVYSGYSHKSNELYLIKDVLNDILREYDTKVLIISEKDPLLDSISYDYIPYVQEKIPSLLLKGDIKIAPRAVDNSYNKGHSFSKVAYPMAVGLPVVASPVPSYLNREVLICRSENEWYESLKELITKPDLRNYLGRRGIDFIKRNYSRDVIGKQYLSFITFIIGV